MLSDIEIAQQATLKPITEIACSLGITPDELEPYGKYNAKLSDELFDRLKDKKKRKISIGNCY